MLTIGRIISHAKAPPEKTIKDTLFPIIKPTEIRAGDRDIPIAKVDLKKRNALEKVSGRKFNPDCINFIKAPKIEALMNGCQIISSD